MATLNTSIWVPAYSTDIQRGGGCSALMIQTLADYSAVYTAAMWDLLALFSQKKYDIGSQGGGTKPLDVELCDGAKITLDDNSDATALLTKSIVFTTLRENMMQFIDTVKGKKYFIMDLVSRVGTSKRVLFGFGYFDLKSARTSQFSSAVSYDITFVVKADGLSSAPTLPALPANSDAKFLTDDMSKQYLGWLLAAADATKGGYGNAVTLPDTSTELTRSSVGYMKTF